jgi:hypothetical protein
MADEWRESGPDRRSSTDVDHAVGIAGNHVCRLLAGAYRDDGTVLVGLPQNTNFLRQERRYSPTHGPGCISGCMPGITSSN